VAEEHEENHSYIYGVCSTEMESLPAEFSVLVLDESCRPA